VQAVGFTALPLITIGTVVALIAVVLIVVIRQGRDQRP
jgi:hypothetical protein